jgi:branched-chain amino acid transport system ATP-binding protein
MFLDVYEIDTFYDVFQAIFQVSLNINQGEVVCLLGRNGAGKTTTLSSIIGLNHPRSGSIKYKDMEISKKKPFQISQLGIGFVPENRWIFSDLTVRENLELGQRKAKGKKHAIGLEGIYGLFPKLKELAGQYGGTLSGGEQQMLTIGRTLMGDPELLLLDEPTAGLAPIVSKMLGNQIERLKEERLTILLTEQNALFAMGISDRAYVIDKGSIVYKGNAKELSEDKDTMKEYLGV